MNLSEILEIFPWSEAEVADRALVAEFEGYRRLKPVNQIKKEAAIKRMGRRHFIRSAFLAGSGLALATAGLGWCAVEGAKKGDESDGALLERAVAKLGVAEDSKERALWKSAGFEPYSDEEIRRTPLIF